jgi:hypothetical protein
MPDDTIAIALARAKDFMICIVVSSMLLDDKKLNRFSISTAPASSMAGLDIG